MDDKNTEQDYKELKEKADLADQYLDKLVRLQAEVENIRKRSAKEKAEFMKYANTELINDFISILDEFQFAKDSAEKNHDPKLLFQGVDMITRHLDDILKNQGLSVIAETGVLFNHDRHDAVEMLESNEYEDNTVVEVLKKGYSINGKVIRPAMVKVSKKKQND